MEEHTDIAYVKDSAAGGLHAFDLYVPAAQPRAGPLLVFVHGGAWRSEDKAKHAPLARRLAHTARCAVAVPNYRLTTPASGLRHPAHAEDLLAFLEFARGWAGPGGDAAYDPARLYVAGHSCSAHMVASILLAPSDDAPVAFPTLAPSDALLASVRGVIATEGLYDIDLLLQSFPTYKEWFIASTFGEHASYAAFSVSQYNLRPGAEHIRWLIAHSTKDPLVDILQSEAMIQRLESFSKANVESYLELSCEDHNGVLMEDKYHELVSSFISRMEG
ncbi:alpha/beta hydrolase [Phanerochaete sordida]|uniref:Alpha/beta hydrolase n=1 Tax=Phanerochaete sordida TaxID=48140 RepID=A0A9P3L9J0_9APHY|nr:alpha/beta hydrolase [Phanerochaete sordida]